MKVDFKLHPFNINSDATKIDSQEIGFSLVGQTIIPKDLLTEPQTNIQIEIKNKILTELVNLLQLELYGKVMSNEPEQGGENNAVEQ